MGLNVGTSLLSAAFVVCKPCALLRAVLFSSVLSDLLTSRISGRALQCREIARTCTHANLGSACQHCSINGANAGGAFATFALHTHTVQHTYAKRTHLATTGGLSPLQIAVTISQ
jgi:hypothetical protein